MSTTTEQPQTLAQQLRETRAAMQRELQQMMEAIAEIEAEEQRVPSEIAEAEREIEGLEAQIEEAEQLLRLAKASTMTAEEAYMIDTSQRERARVDEQLAEREARGKSKLHAEEAEASRIAEKNAQLNVEVFGTATPGEPAAPDEGGSK